ncbi:acetate--CoA ligase family protein [Desulfurivibrio dismutans]|uniref:acetate--CoA ligase family protein n=1 Tax=Desulfurivibrio dismutans TaxID=1398908 RepID=UPI0023DC7239|nr:acetate--CoA ligase [Desulfurivibrio alkaliphilus]MDF1614740.1 acetate--CoA ligase family protein [Desulfurivibrio alkaliphilus]
MSELSALLYPQTVAVIGASRTPGKVGHDILANLTAGGFTGRLLPINPAAKEILGLPCLPALQGSGEQIDLGVIAVPRPLVEAAVEDCLAAGARAVAVITAGFKEMDAAGAALESKLAELCHRRQARLLGPNCLGLINSHHRLNASFAGKMPTCGNISVISQSGALATAILDLAAGRHLGLAKLVSIGNKADLSEVDLLSALAADDQTGVIVAYLEDISSGDDFVRAATEASSRKPVIILKSGTTEAGRQAATSHTGVLAGADIAYGAAFRRAGVIRADTFEALFDSATALAMQPLPRGPRVLIITNAGGPGTMAADAVEQAGLQVAALDQNTAAALREKLPRAASVGNPIDVLGDAEPERYAAAVSAAQDDPAVDAIVVILTPQAMTKPAATARAVAAGLTGDKPVLAAFMGGEEVMPGRAELVAAGLPDYPSPERAVAALKAMHDYASWRRRPPRVVTRFRVNRRRAERIITRRRRSGHRQLGEVRAKNVLAAYGFQIPEGYLATTADEAVEAARRIGFPVAMKVVSPDIVHKSDLGGVKLNLVDAEAARDAFDLMSLRIGQRAPEARIEGLYVEKMLGKGLEVIIGMTRDPQFGPMLMFGLGGIFVEVMKDVTFHLAPISEAEALLMLKSTRSYEILEGRRGQRGVDLAAIAHGLQRISQLTTDFPQIAELDINPFIVGEIGTQPMVADARITLEKVP